MSLPADFNSVCTPEQPVAHVCLKSRCLWFLTGRQLKAQGSFQVSRICFVPSLVLSLSSAASLPSSHYLHLNHLVNQISQRQSGLIHRVGFNGFVQTDGRERRDLDDAPGMRPQLLHCWAARRAPLATSFPAWDSVDML